VRKWIVLLACLVILVLVNLAVIEREELLANGRVVLIELAPVDPRSLIQGDYMALRYRIADEVRPLIAPGRDDGTFSGDNRDGAVIVSLDERSVATFVRLDDGRPPGVGEARLRYRVREGELKFATNAFFFEEGTADRYEMARFGEFRADEDGNVLLTGLRGVELEVLGR
jgi:uncharacterized membrane-anchored protein